ncbi:MAG TPA: hypothetical protein VFJ99_06150 [Solirubrobacterales bacterium]|nr:hypothetical protein [Solirubrobacterales bacterium]
MSNLVIRCRSCTPASAAELTDWLEAKLAELRERTPQLLVRLTRLAQDLPEATVEDGWLIEVESQGERPEEPFTTSMASLEAILSDMRILGLDPTLLVPVRLPFGERPIGSASFSTSGVKT